MKLAVAARAARRTRWRRCDDPTEGRRLRPPIGGRPVRSSASVSAGARSDTRGRRRGRLVVRARADPARGVRGPDQGVHSATPTPWIVARAERDAGKLRGALAGGHRGAAQDAWRATWSDYLHLGAVYGLFGDARRRRSTGCPAGCPGGGRTRTSPACTGSRWGCGPAPRPRSPVPAARGSSATLARLHAVLPALEITPLDYATRAHEILEDAQRDFLTGAGIPWSGRGRASPPPPWLAATRSIMRTLRAAAARAATRPAASRASALTTLAGAPPSRGASGARHGGTCRARAARAAVAALSARRSSGRRSADRRGARRRPGALETPLARSEAPPAERSSAAGAAAAGAAAPASPAQPRRAERGALDERVSVRRRAPGRDPHARRRTTPPSSRSTRSRPTASDLIEGAAGLSYRARARSPAGYSFGVLETDEPPPDSGCSAQAPCAGRADGDDRLRRLAVRRPLRPRVARGRPG